LNQVVPNDVGRSDEKEVDVDPSIWVDSPIEIIQQVFEDDAKIMNRQDRRKDIENGRSDYNEIQKVNATTIKSCSLYSTEHMDSR